MSNPFKIITLLIFAALVMVSLASLYFPVAMSHLGDSGSTKYKTKRPKIGAEMAICNFCQSLRPMAARPTMASPKAKGA